MSSNASSSSKTVNIVEIHSTSELPMEKSPLLQTNSQCGSNKIPLVISAKNDTCNDIPPVYFVSTSSSSGKRKSKYACQSTLDDIDELPEESDVGKYFLLYRIVVSSAK